MDIPPEGLVLMSFSPNGTDTCTGLRAARLASVRIGLRYWGEDECCSTLGCDPSWGQACASRA